MVESIYSDVYDTLIGNTKLLKLLAMTEPHRFDYGTMLEERKDDIKEKWEERTEISNLQQRYAPELAA